MIFFILSYLILAVLCVYLCWQRDVLKEELYNSGQAKVQQAEICVDIMDAMRRFSDAKMSRLESKIECMKEDCRACSTLHGRPPMLNEAWVKEKDEPNCFSCGAYKSCGDDFGYCPVEGTHVCGCAKVCIHYGPADAEDKDLL